MRIKVSQKDFTMIKLQGTMINFIEKSTYKSEQGEVPTKAKLQILIENKRANGSIVKDLQTISIPDDKINMYKNSTSKEVTVDVGIISKSYSFYGI
jgi:hypothetical protein